MMNISKKYNPISCNDDLTCVRFHNILSKLSNPNISVFRLDDWATVCGVGLPNKTALKTLLTEYGEKLEWYMGEKWDLDDLSDTDYAGFLLLIILHDSKSFGLVAICEDEADLNETLEDLIRDLICKKQLSTPKKEVNEIKPMGFYDCFKLI